MAKFAYAVGRIRALEARLLSESQMVRMIEAKDFDSAYAIFRENPYWAAKIDKLTYAFDFETLLEQELVDTQNLLEYLAPKNEMLNALWKKYQPDISFADYLKYLKKVSQKYQISLFTKYVEGFTILNQLKINLFSEKTNLEEIENRYRHSDYYLAIKIGLGEFQKSGSLFALEREIDNFLLVMVKKAKYQVFGFEPLLGFALAKENEIKILRLILTAKKLQVKPEKIKERLRLSYV
ncbi:MAG: V-type ATPase subunit [Candidatus Margulisiibacteriota bacterium]